MGKIDFVLTELNLRLIDWLVVRSGESFDWKIDWLIEKLVVCWGKSLSALVDWFNDWLIYSFAQARVLTDTTVWSEKKTPLVRFPSRTSLNRVFTNSESRKWISLPGDSPSDESLCQEILPQMNPLWVKTLWNRLIQSIDKKEKKTLSHELWSEWVSERANEWA